MELGRLIEGLPIEVVGPDAGKAARIRVCDLTDDSRTAVPGSLFIARRGHSQDGRLHAPPAVECGAVAVLTDDKDIDLGERARAVVLFAEDVPGVTGVLGERFYGEPSRELELVGITGTNGKTTVAHAVQGLLQACGVRSGLIGTVQIDDGREVARAVLTTPGAIEISRTLATMVESGCAACVMEVSSHALDQGRAGGLGFDVGVFTNLSGDHLDYHGDEESYARAKRRLFEMLPGDGVAVVNADDARAAWMGDGAPEGVELRACSLGDTGAPWLGSVERATIDGMDVHVRGPEFELRGRVGLIGGFNAMNVLEAVAAADAVLGQLGWEAGDRAGALGEALGEIRVPAGRLERVHASGGLTEHGEYGVRVFVDFAHTDDALSSTLRAVRPVLPEGGKLVVVFGCGGDRDQTKRPRMGRAAVELADRVLVTSDNPRTESPNAIIAQVLEGIPPSRRADVEVHVEREHAIREAILAAGDRDVVVIAGKGHETEQISTDGMGGLVRRHFDDREVAGTYLRERRLRGASPEPEGVA